MGGKFLLWEQLDLPGESFPGETLVEIIGNRQVLIENHCGVREYSRECICVKVRHGLVNICGGCLELRRMSREHLVVSGRIDGISINNREGK